MALSKKATKATEATQEKRTVPELDIKDVVCTKVGEYETPNGAEYILFNMTAFNGALFINGCKLFYDGVNQRFWMAFPSYKGKNGNYYNHCFFKPSDATMEKIAKQLDA